VYSATTFLALCGVIDQATAGERHRVGLFSYGSGCSSEFFSGVVAADAGAKLAEFGMNQALERRYQLSFDEYESLIGASQSAAFGTEAAKIEVGGFSKIYDQFYTKGNYLLLDEIKDYHRSYRWSAS
jgi:polyketide biosynthesis 3-hydroxy-3-methylglutaryl-CoA synthase-like enzyme PksG